ncbi:MAG: hypothetical protein ACK4N5_19675 [Myxococcales bacterium]
MARVLLFETTSGLASQLEWLLEADGHDVVELSGPDAVRALPAGPYDVAVLDIADTTGRGRAVLEALRADARLAKVPVLALTAAMVRCPEAAAEIWMPFDPKHLLDEIRRVVFRGGSG